MAGEARRMQRLVVDLLSLSRIESDKDRLPTATIDLAAITRTVVDELRRSDPDRGADLEIDCAHTIPPIIGDRAQMSQLLHNLVGNAMKYGRAGTPVTVRLEPGDTGDVTLTVVDRGDGIPPEHLPRPPPKTDDGRAGKRG